MKHEIHSSVICVGESASSIDDEYVLVNSFFWSLYVVSFLLTC